MGQDHQATPERVLQRLTDLLQGDEEPSSGEVSYLIDNLSAPELHHFFDSLIESANKTSSGDSSPVAFVSALRTKRNDDKALSRFRLAVGPWYSSVILADLCALDPNETNIEKRLEQRMQALVREALAWVPDGIFSQVVLTIHTPNATDMEKSQVWFCSCAGGPNAQENHVKQFDELTDEYAKEYGTSAFLKLHLRANHRISESGQEKPLAPDNPFSLRWPDDSKGSAEALHPGPIFSGSLNELHPNTAKPQQGDFLKSLQSKIDMYREKKLSLLHIASGIDFPGKDEGPSATVAHLYIVRQSKESCGIFPPLFKQYEETMDVLLYKLAHFYTLERYFEEKRALKKRDQMLRLLERPLGRVSEAIRNTEADMQRLRAILYDPSRGLFSVAPQTMRYFEQHRQFTRGHLIWKGLHEPMKAKKNEAKDLACMVAAVTCEIFGCMDFELEWEGDLYSRAVWCLSQGDEAFKDIRQLTLDVLGGDCEALKTWLSQPNDDAHFRKLQEAGARLKDMLFTPFKDGEKRFPLLPLLAVLLWGGQGNVSVTVNAGQQERTDGKLSAFFVLLEDSKPYPFKGLCLPVPRYALVLSFLQGVIAFSEQQLDKATVIIDENKETKIQLTFTKEIFPTDKKSELNVRMNTVIKNTLEAPNEGNFYKPFLDLAAAMRGEPKFDLSFEVLKLEHDRNQKTVIEYTANSLTYVTTRIDGAAES